MTRDAGVVGLLVWAGATLLLSQWRRINRASLADRLRPYSPGGTDHDRPAGILSVESMGEVIGPLARGGGARVAAVFGVSEELELRLRRVHSPLDVTGFRLRQLAWSGGGLLAGLLAAGLGLPLPVAGLCIAGAPLLAFLAVEQRLASASDARKARVRRELPVVGEQLATLINSGYSLGAALNRIADRGQGACAQDLRGVVNRIRQGVGETQALREWAEVAQVDTLDRLVGVLALNSEASDLGRLVGIEARQGRRDLQRHTTEIIERRAQQVWVPVTVATLVPGVILLAVPFLSALRLFSSA